MNDYLTESLSTDQSMPMPGKDQIENAAGGFVFEVSPWTRLRRFLVLGSEGGTYYASERKLTTENVSCLADCVKESGVRVVEEARLVSVEGRAPKNDPAIFALAYVAAHGDLESRRAALDAVTDVCRTGTHLFTFCGYVSKQRGWGRGLKRAVAAWYESHDPQSLAYQLVKYRQRGGWSHRDVLRLAHPQAADVRYKYLYDFACGREEDPAPLEMADEGAGLLQAFRDAQKATTAAETVRLIKANNLPREAVKSEFLDDANVWEALLEAGGGMPVIAMVRNLGNMSKVGLATPMSNATQTIVSRLTDEAAVAASRIHPIQVLAANMTYKQGHGMRGSGEWEVAPQIVDALDRTFELSFGNVEPTNKRTMLALDVSGSMASTWGPTLANVPGLTPRIGSAAMALLAARTEPRYQILGFSHELVPIGITAGSSLGDAVGAVSGLPFGGTDCALPMIHARETGAEVDTFIVYTDNETWAGRSHPAEALRDYRRESGIDDAKLVVCGMTATECSIADPDDPGMMDVVGFDTATPQLISEFSKGL